MSVTVCIDTEEDNWASWVEAGATCRNIEHLPELQELLARWGPRPTYLVNRPPLLSPASVAVLGEIAEVPGVEIGAHCHPWNTPPSTGAGQERSMMCNLPLEANKAKLQDITARIESELGVRPVSFRAGRWGFGPTVAPALAELGYLVDVSVTPFIDWTADGGPDYSREPHRPYRFDPRRPFEPNAAGTMVELPATVGFVRGEHRSRAAARRWLARSPLRRLKVLGALDRLGVLRRRWLSPESSSGEDMVALAEACLRSGEPVLGLTFHSCTLLPGATPFVRDADDRRRFLGAIERFLRFCSERGLAFRTVAEVATPLLTSKAT